MMSKFSKSVCIPQVYLQRDSIGLSLSASYLNTICEDVQVNEENTYLGTIGSS